MSSPTLNATELAATLRLAAAHLDSGEFMGVFAARLEVAIPVARLIAFCEAANDCGTAPDFFALVDWMNSRQS